MRCNGQEHTAHVANSGRLRELLRPENPMLLAPAPTTAHRKTAFDLALVEVDGALVSADARLPNALVREAIEADRLSPFEGYDAIRPEVVFEDSRLDLVLSGPSGLCYVEVKSVTLVEKDVGLFPDAPTERGRRHLLSLRKAVQQGHRAAVVFVIQRANVLSFAPNESADPKFWATLRSSVEDGLEVYAYRCKVTRTQIDLADPVPVHLSVPSESMSS